MVSESGGEDTSEVITLISLSPITHVLWLMGHESMAGGRHFGTVKPSRYSAPSGHVWTANLQVIWGRVRGSGRRHLLGDWGGKNGTDRGTFLSPELEVEDDDEGGEGGGSGIGRKWVKSV